MTRPRRSSTADRVFGRVPTGGGHVGPPNVVVGWTGSGEGDPELVEGSGLAGPLTRSGWSGGHPCGHRSTRVIALAADPQGLPSLESRLSHLAILPRGGKR